ncbi:SDR family oxidoreductase [Gemmata sp.]|uniref:SDR family oxidoreductase n=1 Tax=Gemmata sp. TaxID=1914242 RepID=UPI003F6E5E4B
MADPQDRPKAPLPPQTQSGPGLESQMTPRPQYLAPDYPGSGKLKGKAALITGGDSGIGRAVAVLFAREGADVAIVYLKEEQSDAEETRAAVEKEGRKCLLLPGDVTDFGSCRDAVEKTVKALGRLDVLVNNAAYQKQQDEFEDITLEQFDRTFKTNIYGYFHMVKAALPHLKEGASVINVGSVAGVRGTGRLMDYAATKGAIHAFTKALATNFVKRKVRVNCVAPGPVWTPFIPMSEPANQVAKHGEKTPLERPAQPEEVAPTFVFLASNADSSYITGEVITLAGGETTAG